MSLREMKSRRRRTSVPLLLLLLLLPEEVTGDEGEESDRRGEQIAAVGLLRDTSALAVAASIVPSP